MMQVYTEEQRKALIADCEEEIAYLKSSMETAYPMFSVEVYQSKLHRQQLALASLTAEPVGYTSDFYLEVAGNRDHPCRAQFSQHRDDDEFRHALYTAPPAPALRLPKEADGSNLPFAANGWNACLAEVKRLNATAPVMQPVKLPAGTEVNGFIMLVESEVISYLSKAGVEAIPYRAAGYPVEGE